MKYLTFLLLLIAGCQPGNNKPARQLNFETFGNYWYQGKAEINTYALAQFRYGEKREAEAETRAMRHAVEKHFRREQDRARAAARRRSGRAAGTP